jgi:hypothetical protein
MPCNKVQDSGALESTLFYLLLTWNGENLKASNQHFFKDNSIRMQNPQISCGYPGERRSSVVTAGKVFY